jgi:hypothetical protein
MRDYAKETLFMDNTELRKLLEQLHEEIKKTQAVDKKGGELLRDLDGDIRALLDRSDENPEPLHPSVVQNLEGTLDHFEVSHPTLTAQITRVLEFLSTSGI